MLSKPAAGWRSAEIKAPSALARLELAEAPGLLHENQRTSLPKQRRPGRIAACESLGNFIPSRNWRNGDSSATRPKVDPRSR